jgi:hypothetical protein
MSEDACACVYACLRVFVCARVLSVRVKESDDRAATEWTADAKEAERKEISGGKRKEGMSERERSRVEMKRRRKNRGNKTER